MLFRFTLLFFIISTLGLIGQDSITDINDTNSFATFSARRINSDYIAVDSNLTPNDIERFNPFNRILNYNYDLGNLATKSHFKILDQNEEYNYIKGIGDIGYYNVFEKKEDVPFFRVKSPIAELHYMSGYKRGSHFGGYFSQNVTPNWNYYLAYTRTHSEGKYFRQETVYDNLNLSTNFSSKNKRYSAEAIVIWNKLKNEENGGISDRSEFEDNLVTARELVNINLWNSKGFGRKTQVYYNQAYSLKSDSSGVSGLGLYHKLDFKDQNYRFTSTDSIFDNYYFGEETRDSTHHLFVYNEGGFTWKVNSESKTVIKAGAYYAYQDYGSLYYRKTQGDLGLTLSYNSDFDLKNRINASVFYNIGNPGSSFKVDYIRRVGVKSELNLYASYNSQEAAFVEQAFISNQHIWSNNFKNKSVLNTGLGYSLNKNLKLDVNYSDWSNHVYFDKTGSPMQLDSKISMLNGSLSALFSSSNGFGLDINVGVNKMLDGEEYYRLPEFITQSKLFWNFDAYNKALTGQFGIQLKYFTSYKANYYNPTNGSFYLQDNEFIGNFFYLNGYGSFKIKTLRVYLMVENILKGLIPYDYYSIPGYPMPDRVFRIGFKWRFFN